MNTTDVSMLVRSNTLPGGATYRAYQTWYNMHRRCTEPTYDSYPQYGGQGVNICARWYEFANFVSDMGEQAEGTYLVRRDLGGHYEPGNCVWSYSRERSRPAARRLPAGGGRCDDWRPHAPHDWRTGPTRIICGGVE